MSLGISCRYASGDRKRKLEKYCNKRNLGKSIGG